MSNEHFQKGAVVRPAGRMTDAEIERIEELRHQDDAAREEMMQLDILIDMVRTWRENETDSDELARIDMLLGMLQARRQDVVEFLVNNYRCRMERAS